MYIDFQTIIISLIFIGLVGKHLYNRFTKRAERRFFKEVFGVNYYKKVPIPNKLFYYTFYGWYKFKKQVLKNKNDLGDIKKNYYHFVSDRIEFLQKNNYIKNSNDFPVEAFLLKDIEWKKFVSKNYGVTLYDKYMQDYKKNGFDIANGLGILVGLFMGLIRNSFTILVYIGFAFNLLVIIGNTYFLNVIIHHAINLIFFWIILKSFINYTLDKVALL